MAPRLRRSQAPQTCSRADHEGTGAVRAHTYKLVQPAGLPQALTSPCLLMMLWMRVLQRGVRSKGQCTPFISRKRGIVLLLSPHAHSCGVAQGVTPTLHLQGLGRPASR